MNEKEILELRKKSAKAVIEALDEMTAKDVSAVLAAEKGNNAPRKTVVDAANARLADLDAFGGEAADAADPAEPPAWQAADYTGPLDILQADWRNANLK